MKAGVIGASGFAGSTLAKLLLEHKEIELPILNSESHAGKNISSIYPDFRFAERFTGFSLQEINNMNLDIVFLALPDGMAKKIVPKIKTKIIDLGRDYRCSKNAVYGLPEIFPEQISSANLVANPGCFATACILAAFPLAAKGLTDALVFDCKSGVSGAGRGNSDINNFNNLSENIFAYKLVNHKHVKEISSVLKTQAHFTPHVIPVRKGIMCTAHVITKKLLEKKKLLKIYDSFYCKKPFVSVSKTIPELHAVQGTNSCKIGGFESSKGHTVIVSTIDNLMKGAASQAIQNMNLMLGFKETEGLLSKSFA